MFEPLTLGESDRICVAVARFPAVPIDRRLEAHLLHCAIATLREARECASGEADAPTIYARIDGLLSERRERLDELLQPGAEMPTEINVGTAVPQAPRGAL